MILLSLKATNFKKFKEVDLYDLPQRGLVGIVGPNEAGKSTIIDAITFALFAKTEITDQGGLESLIHWAEDVCQVEMVFEVPDGKRYRLFREVDRMGDHLAQLEELSGKPKPKDVVSAATRALSLEEPSSITVNGPVRVARALKKLLGYTYDDFRNSFLLAQHGTDAMGAAATGAPDWSGVLFRMTGIATMDKAIEKAEGVAESIRQEIRQVEDELEVQGRVLAAMGVTAADEEELKGDIEELERDIAANEAARDSLRRRQQDTAQRVEARQQASREMGGLALAVLEEQLANDVTALARGLEQRRERLAKDRTEAEAARTDARAKHEGVARLRYLFDELASRLGERRHALDSKLSSDSPESLVDERQALNRQIKSMRGRGRGGIGFGIFLLVLAAAAGAFVAFGAELIVLPPPVLPEHLQWGAIGAAIVGMFFIIGGARARRRGRALIGNARVRLEDLDQQIAQLMSEREVLVGDVLNVARDARAPRIQDDRVQAVVRELNERYRTFLDRELGIDDYAKEAGREVDDADRRLRHLDASAERLDHLLQSARAQADELAVLVETPPPATQLDEIDLGTLEDRVAQLKQRSADLARRLNNDRRPVSERMALLHEQVDRFGAAAAARLGDLDQLLRGPEKTGAGSERKLVAHVDALIAALPSESELRAEVQRVAGGAEEIERKLAELRTRISERKNEMERMKPQFDKRRTVDEEIESLKAKLEDLHTECEREVQATRLLQGAADQLRSRLAPAIGRSLGARLDRITGGRYSRVNVDLDFGINIYSDERNAFVHTMELSGGTHDQLLLSLRLAFAEVLLATRGITRGPHLLLLDEPLDGFDSARARRFVALLREGGGPLAQVFLLAAQEEVASYCDLTVRASLEGTELRVSGQPSKPLTQSVRARQLTQE